MKQGRYPALRREHVQELEEIRLQLSSLQEGVVAHPAFVPLARAVERLKRATLMLQRPECSRSEAAARDAQDAVKFLEVQLQQKLPGEKATVVRECVGRIQAVLNRAAERGSEA